MILDMMWMLGSNPCTWSLIYDLAYHLKLRFGYLRTSLLKTDQIKVKIIHIFQFVVSLVRISAFFYKKEQEHFLRVGFSILLHNISNSYSHP